MRVSVRAAIAICFGPVLLSACSTNHFAVLSDDFGVAERQDLAAQVADPDARYRGIPTPGSNGIRQGIAQSRYVRDAVIPPATTSTSSIPVTGGGGDNSGGGAGAGAGTAAGMP